MKVEFVNDKLEQYGGKDNQAVILIVDDHPILRQGLAQLINHEADLRVCAEAETADQALEILEKQCFNLAIVDISLIGTDGIGLTEKIKLRYPDLPVLILTMHDEVLYAKRAFRAGAKGYLVKRDAAETIVTAVRIMLGGKEYISRSILQKLSANTV